MPPSETSASKGRVLAICNIDVMAALLLRPWLSALAKAGYEVHVACAPGHHVPQLQADGFIFHPLPVRRTFNPVRNLRAIFQAWQLVRCGAYDAVNMHSPIGAAVGRVACTLARAQTVIYTVHGFYFHDEMPAIRRSIFTGIERLLGRATSQFMFVSDEDRQTALRTHIARYADRATTIYNGVDLDKYRPASNRDALRASLGLPVDRALIGIVGRIVREKGYGEFLQMAQALTETGRAATFVVIGDSLDSDRDQFATRFRDQVERSGLASRFHFAGFTDRVPAYLRALDIFVLPSYREGFPRSLLEAMATAIPVVATDIRGSREAVVHDVTGVLVPSRNSRALTTAVIGLLDDPLRAKRMGQAGRRRAEDFFSEQKVQARFVSVFDALLAPAPKAPDAL